MIQCPNGLAEVLFRSFASLFSFLFSLTALLFASSTDISSQEKKASAHPPSVIYI